VVYEYCAKSFANSATSLTFKLTNINNNTEENIPMSNVRELTRQNRKNNDDI